MRRSLTPLFLAFALGSSGVSAQRVMHVRSFEPMPGATDKQACKHWRETAASHAEGLKVDCKARTVTQTIKLSANGQSVDSRKAQFNEIVCNEKRGYLGLMQRGWRFIDVYRLKDSTVTFEPTCS